MDQKGFTLIETIIYLALFVIVIGGGMVAAYQIIESTEANKNHVILQEEANFLLRKINWALTGATSVAETGTTLTVQKPIGGASTQLVFSLNGSSLELARSLGTPSSLNTSNIALSNLAFAKTLGAGGRPDALTTTFTLTTLQNGLNDSQTFSTKKYLRQ